MQLKTFDLQRYQATTFAGFSPVAAIGFGVVAAAAITPASALNLNSAICLAALKGDCTKKRHRRRARPRQAQGGCWTSVTGTPGWPASVRLSSPGALWLAGRRCHRSRRGDRFRERRERGGVGRCIAGAAHVLVLHRPVQDAGLLGLLLPVTQV